MSAKGFSKLGGFMFIDTDVNTSPAFTIMTDLALYRIHELNNKRL
jgi:hypothetical protein